MRRVFLSYRRDDTQFITSFIYQQLEDPSAFGLGSVFMDIDDIPPGVDFRDVIDDAVSQCEFFVAVIGKHWATPRLMNPNDFVRLEIEAALQRQIPVTPLLVDGAVMPRVDDLPPSLHPLLYKNAKTIRHGRDFKPDVMQLVAGLHKSAEWYRLRAVQPSPLHNTKPMLKTGDRLEVPLPGGLSMAFAYCPPGQFWMGGTANDDEKPVHTVTLTKGFYAGVYAVTQEQYQAVMGTNPSHFKGPKRPVEQVSWSDSQEFLVKLSKLCGREIRLPTEAEWEYFCRAGSTTDYCNGDDEAALHRVGWFDSNSKNETHPVGELSPNQYSLYDCHGNLWEWCLDWYDDKAYQRGDCQDPTGPKSGSFRVLRGGGWYNYAPNCRSADRDRNDPSHRCSNLGFRCVAVQS